MNLPTPYAVGVRRHVPGATDAHGNPADEWAEPVLLPVHGIAPGGHVEPGEANRDLSEIVYTLYVPTHPNLPHERDLVVVDGVEFAVDGRPQDWNRGPFGFAPGWVILLKRTEG